MFALAHVLRSFSETDFCHGVQVIKLISQVIADFADGEIGQQARAYDTKLTISEYMDKSFYKTATLIAASCKGAAVFSDCSVDVKNAMFEFGRHLGLAFQVVDDILDFTQSSAQLGKPQVSSRVSQYGQTPAGCLCFAQSKFCFLVVIVQAQHRVSVVFLLTCIVGLCLCFSKECMGSDQPPPAHVQVVLPPGRFSCSAAIILPVS